MESRPGKLTPSKIQRLLHLAESSTPGAGAGAVARRREEPAALAERMTLSSSQDSKSNTQCESSGILDLDRCEGFGDSGLSGMIDKFNINMSFSKSTTFNPGEMTGRSTGADDFTSQISNLTDGPSGVNHDFLLPATASVDELAARMEQQSCDVADIVRHSIANFSFQTNRDLTQDEMSFIKERGELPIPPSQLNLNLTNTVDKKWTEYSLKADTTSDISVGSYFRKGSVDLVKMIGRSDSPSYEVSMGPSLLEGDSRNYGLQPGFTTINDSASDCPMDATLDHVPTKQPRLPPAIFCAPSLQHLAPLTSTKTDDSTLGDQSLSLSLIAKYLQGESEAKPSILITEAKRNKVIKSDNPLIKKDSNAQQNYTFTIPKNNPNKSRLVPTELSNPHFATSLKKAARSDTAASTGSVDTLINTYGGHGKSNKENIYKEPAHKMRNQEKLGENIIHLNKETYVDQEDSHYNEPTYAKKHQLTSGHKDNQHISGHRDNQHISGHKDNQHIFGHKQDDYNKSQQIKMEANKQLIPLVDSTNSTSDYGKESKTTPATSKSSRSACTVQENRISTSIGSEDSPQHTRSREGALLPLVVSPNSEYRELDKSVNWQDLLLQNKWVDEDQWVEVEIDPKEAYVGICTTVSVKLTSLTDTWLTARLKLDDSSPDEGNLALDIPRFPVLLSPGSTKTVTITATAFKQLTQPIKLNILLKDTCEGADMQQDAILNISFIMPKLKIITAEDSEVIKFAPMQELSETVKSFVIMSDCTETLQLALSVSEGAAIFSIMNVEVITLENIERRLAADHRLVSEEGMRAGSKYRAVKSSNKLMCVLPRGYAVKVMMMCQAPQVPKETRGSEATLTGSLSVHLLDTYILMKEVAITGTVGTVKLLLKTTGDKLHVKSEVVLPALNSGSIPGSWNVLVRVSPLGDSSAHFAVEPRRVDILPGTTVDIMINYIGPQDELTHGVLIFENVHESKDTILELSGGPDKLTIFPIKTTQSELSWVREGKKEINLKNSSDRRVTVNCKVHGDGYTIEYAKEQVGTEIVLTFAPNECKGLCVSYEPEQKGIHKAKLALCLDKDQSCVKSVRLHGCSSGGAGAVTWAGSVLTCGGVALVLATRRTPLTLTLSNRSHEQAFYSAKLQFNMQYRALGAWSRVSPPRGVIPANGNTRLTVELDWARLDRLLLDSVATTLASLSVIVGSEITRRRILRILNTEQSSKPTGSPAECFSRLKGLFHGEDHMIDVAIKDFEETKKSLNTLTGSLQELTAQIELARDGTEDGTILIADETGIEHHTLLD